MRGATRSELGIRLDHSVAGRVAEELAQPIQRIASLAQASGDRRLWLGRTGLPQPIDGLTHRRESRLDHVIGDALRRDALGVDVEPLPPPRPARKSWLESDDERRQRLGRSWSGRMSLGLPPTRCPSRVHRAGRATTSSY